MRAYRLIAALVLSMVFTLSMSAQIDKREVRRGNRSFGKSEYRQADIDYRKALMKDSTSVAANYNLANNCYRQESWEEAGSWFEKIKDSAPLSEYASNYYYNSGNVSVQKKDWQAAVDSYKQALLRNPGDLEAKENYIYAKKMLENQQNGGGGDNQDNQDQNNQDNQDNQNQNQDQNQDQNQQNNQDNQNQNQGQNGQNQQPKISPQQAQQMLQAIQAKEKETQVKVNKEKAAALKSRQRDKNW